MSEQDWPRYFLARLQEDLAAELEHRRARANSPGGQQVGPSEYSGMPMSLLKRLERECRHMLERTDDLETELAKYGDAVYGAKKDK